MAGQETSIMSGRVREGAALAARTILTHIAMISMLFSALMAPWNWAKFKSSRRKRWIAYGPSRHGRRDPCPSWILEIKGGVNVSPSVNHTPKPLAGGIDA